MGWHLRQRDHLGLPLCAQPGCDRDGWSLSLALSDDGRLLATSQYGGRGYLGTDYQGAVTVWNASIGEPLARIALPKDGLMLADQKLAFSEDRSRLAVHLGDHVQVWRLGDVVPGERPEKTIQRSDLPVELERVLLLPLEDQEPYRERSLGFSGAGTRLVAGRGSVVAWETGTWRQVWRWVPPSPYSEIGWELGQDFAVPANDEVLVTAGGVWKPKTASKEREHADREG